MKGFIRKIWDAIVKFFSSVPYDKLLHFIAGLIIAAFFNVSLGMLVCIIPALFAGFIKEFFDLWTTDQWDWWDFVATVSGGAVIQVFAILGHVWGF